MFLSVQNQHISKGLIKQEVQSFLGVIATKQLFRNNYDSLSTGRNRINTRPAVHPGDVPSEFSRLRKSDYKQTED